MKLRVGIIGAGQIAREVHLPVLHTVPDVKIGWIADADETVARETAAAYKIEHASLKNSAKGLPECDIALLAIPVHARNEYYEEFSKRGVAVFAEKPITIGSDSHAKLLQDFQPHQLACGYMKRFYSTTISLRKIIESGMFGIPKRVRISDGNRTTRTGRDNAFQDRPYAKGGGVLLQVGCHGLDLGCHLTGAKNFEIISKQVQWDNQTDRRVEAHIRLKEMFGGTDSCDFEFHSSWLDRKNPGVQVEFDSVRIEVGAIANSPMFVSGIAGKPKFILSENNGGALTVYQSFHLEWADFVRGVIAKKPCRISAESSKITTDLVEQLTNESKL